MFENYSIRIWPYDDGWDDLGIKLQRCFVTNNKMLTHFLEKHIYYGQFSWILW